MSNGKKTDLFDLTAGVPEIVGEIRPTPKFADRISKRVIAVVLVFLGVLVFIFLLSLDNMDKKKAPPPEIVAEKGALNKEDDGGVPKELLEGKGAGLTGASVVGGLSQTSLVMPSMPNMSGLLPATGIGGVPSLGGSIPPSSGMIPKEPEAGVASAPPLTPEQQAVNQAKQERLVRMALAKTSGISGKSYDIDSSGVGVAASGGASSEMPPGMAEALAMAKNAAAAQTPGGSAKAQGEQDEKLDFVKSAAKDDRGYHPHMAIPALSANEVKTGAFIPLALEQAINSDLPGQISARVTEAVYDSITGCRLLIPAMSKVVGKYDSKVALGQGRMLVVWNSLIFPDGAELNLGGMQGYDTSGQAGLQSDVDNHYLRLFGLTFGMSMVTAAVQLSIPQPNPGANGAAAPQTPSQVISSSLAQQYGQLGSQILNKYMAVQPTLRNFQGERFVIMVPQTILFEKVWNNRCKARDASTL